jgi:glycosyltransferase involved in cell wall biosynthesis
MKVLYISYDGMTDPLGQSQVIPYLQGLVKEGYEFILLSFEKKERLIKNREHIEKILSGSGIAWVPLLFSKRPPFLSKLYDAWKMKRKVMELHRQHFFSFTHCRSYVAAAAGVSLKKRSGVPFLFDMRGFWVDERVDNGQWNLSNPVYKWLYHYYKKRERHYFAEAAHIISLTECGKEELVKNYGLRGNKITVIPCCADLAHFDYNNMDSGILHKLREKLHLSQGDKVLSYLGSLGGWYLLGEMLDFFAALKKAEPSGRFLFITHDDPGNIKAAAMQRGLKEEDILVHPASRQEVPVYLALSNWSIFFIKDAYSKKASSPTKQGEIMAMGIPLICNDIGDTGRIVEESGTGVVLNDFSVASYQQAIAQMPVLTATDPARIRRAAYRYYDLLRGIEKYKEVYQELFS